MLLTIASFLFAIALLVTIHEYGHYWVAKRLGVKVLKFSIGFGKPILSWQRGETLWQIAWIPLGGFVQMLGEEDQHTVPAADWHRTFSGQHPIKKMAIVLAGPLANLLLAGLLFALAYLAGINSLRPVINYVTGGSIAEQSGIQDGAQITRFGRHQILDWEDMRIAALSEVGGGEDIPVTVRMDEIDNQLMLKTKDFSAAEVDVHVLSRLGLSALALETQIQDIAKDSVAAKAGLQAGDRIVAIDGQSMRNWQKIQGTIERAPARMLMIQVQRAEQLIQIQITPEIVQTPQGQVGRIGISPSVDQHAFEQQKFVLQLGVLAALQKGAKKTWDLSYLTLKMMARMVTGQLSANSVSGPIGIAKMAGQSASLGSMVYLQFLALISLSLGVLNLLPVPVLDGGHLLYHGAELVRGRPLPQSWLVVGQKLGIVLLVGLMLLAFYNDINRIITG